MVLIWKWRKKVMDIKKRDFFMRVYIFIKNITYYKYHIFIFSKMHFYKNIIIMITKTYHMIRVYFYIFFLYTLVLYKYAFFILHFLYYIFYISKWTRRPARSTSAGRIETYSCLWSISLQTCIRASLLVGYRIFILEIEYWAYYFNMRSKIII